MKKGQVYEGIITRVDFPNKSRIEVEGESDVAIVKGGIPGQKVRFSVKKRRTGKVEGRLIEVIEKSLDEIAPLCEHFGSCGGCTYQNLPYDKQLRLKENQVNYLIDRALEEYAKSKGFGEKDNTDKDNTEYKWEGIVKSPLELEYRNKMEFTFGDEVKDGPLSLGMHKKGSFYDIVTVSGCKIVDDDFSKILKATLDFFDKAGVPYYHRVRHDGYLRHLLVRKGQKSGEILIDLVTAGSKSFSFDEAKIQSIYDKELFANKTDGEKENDILQSYLSCLEELELKGEIKGVLHTANDSVADVVKDEGTEILFGNDYFYEELLGLKFKISPFSFFQTNSLGAEKLYEKAREYIGDTKDKVIFDLYSGTGTIAQMVAVVAKKVIGVEIVEEAVEAAKANAKLNGISNCEFIAGDVLKVIDEIEEKPDIIILDPPRDGIHPKAIGKIIDYGVNDIVYISCKPTSLARDLVVFEERGYKLIKACAVDMFPQTANVETVALFAKQ